MKMLFCVIVLVGVSCNALANLVDTATISYKSSFSDGTLNIWYTGGSLSGIGGIDTFNKTAGSGLGNLIADGDFLGVCVELPQWASGNSQLYSVSRNTNNYLTELWSRYYDVALEDNRKAEAFSTAVWEIIYESNPVNWNVSSWNETEGTGFKSTGLANGMAALANSWLGSLDGTVLNADLVILSNDSYQNYMTSVPEPATFVILAIGAALIGSYRKECRLTRC